MVAQRRHEIGIRMALGAGRATIVRMVLGRALKLTMAGLAGAWALTRVVASQLYGARGIDPLTLAGVSLVLAAVAVLATYVPVRRALRMSPMTTLRWR